MVRFWFWGEMLFVFKYGVFMWVGVSFEKNLIYFKEKKDVF